MFKQLIIAFLLIINITGLIVTAIDKHKAVRKMWRIPEKVFFILAIIGGCPGIYAGMIVFRHKTRRWYFALGIPLIFFLQTALIYFLNLINAV